MDDETKEPILSPGLEAVLDRGTAGSEIVSFRLPSIPERYRYNSAVRRAAGYEGEGEEPVREPDGWDIAAVYVSMIAACWVSPDVLYPPGGGDPVRVVFPSPREYGRDLVAHGEAVFDVLYRHGCRDYSAVADIGEALYQKALRDLGDIDRRVEGESDF